jgi:NAD/NADP transhydrogenase beta subunit
MEQNVGGYDRLGRFVIGTLLVVGGIAGYTGLFRVAVGPLPQALVALLLVLIGAILVLTGYTRTCPINSVLKINTYRSRSR